MLKKGGLEKMFGRPTKRPAIPLLRRRFLGGKGKLLPGFTLIELLSVIAIIGILVAIGSYLFIGAEAQARDAERKSDLNQIAEAFGARQLDQTCSDQSAKGVYPGESLESDGNPWVRVSALANYSDGCGSFTSFMPTIPNDPSTASTGRTYYFNLSTYNIVNGAQVSAPAAHYRLTTELEHQLSTNEQSACVEQSQIWRGQYGGNYYDCEQQVISAAGHAGVLLVAAAGPPPKQCQPTQILLSNGTCGCPTGETMQSDGTCTVPVNCTGGQVEQADGTCACPTGETEQSDGTCATTTTCPSGETLQADGTCKSSGTNPPTGPYNYYIGA